MTIPDAGAILSRAGLWLAGLREHGQISDEQAARFNEILAESFGERLDQQDDPLLVIMLCGPTAVGKSSLINALAGAEISRPGHAATTGAAVLYVHVQDDPMRLFAYSHALAGRDQPDTTLVRHDRDALLHKVLVDTPDIDSVRLRHRELTAQLVHAADLVLFVTSPEKYKVLRSARWVLEQRGQRGLAFVLNKWDRAALGLQSGQRAAVEADFRTALADEGFPEALVFKVSALPGETDLENELPALRAWLETGIGESTAAALRRRRLRAAWGRLAAAIEAALPEPLTSHPLLPQLRGAIAVHGGLAQQGIAAEALVLEPAGIEDAGRPSTPGLLGMWNRTWQRAGSAGSSLRAGIAAGIAALAARQSGRSNAPAGAADAFGRPHAAGLSEAVDQTLGDAAAQGLPLGPAAPACRAAFAALERDLALLPAGIAADLAAQVARRSFRRLAGAALLYVVEVLILAVLLIAVMRSAADFWNGTYAPAGLMGTVLMLVAILLVIGQTIGGVFFPPVRRRFRQLADRRARTLVQAALDKAETVLRDHVEAVDRLSREGHELLQEIERTTLELATEGASSPAIDRLFAEQAPEPAPEPLPAAQRRPVFD